MQNTRTMENNQARSGHPLRKTRNDRRKGFNPAALLVTLGAILVILPVVLVSAVIIYFQVSQINLPNVILYDQPVGWMNYRETSEKIDLIWNKNLRINLKSEDDPQVSYWLSPAELGLWVDPERTADKAYAVGRGANPFEDVRSAVRNEPKVVMPVLYFDEGLAKETFAKIAEENDLQPVEARLVYENGQWSAMPGSEGRVVDLASTLQSLYQNAFDVLVTGSAVLNFQDISPAVEDLSFVLDDIDAVLSKELSLRAYDPIKDELFSWSVPMEVKRAWISVDPADHSVGLSYTADDVETLLHMWEDELGEGRSFNAVDVNQIIDRWKDEGDVQLAVQHDPTIYTVRTGESLWSISLKLGMPMWYILDANQGLTTNNLGAGMILNIPSKNVLLPLPVVPNKRIVIDISEQVMRIYEDGDLKETHIVSTGVDDSPTMAGIFQVQTHELNAYASNWDLYMPHFMGIYEAWPGFMNGIHGLPLLSSGQRLWASALGSPASYGCIILDLDAAEALYHWADPGVVVEIVQ